MSRKTIRAVIVLGVIVICSIIGIQIYWMKKSFDIQEQQFRQSVMLSLRNVAHEISEVSNFSVIDNPVEQLSSDYYVVNLRIPLEPSVLEPLLIEAFKRRNLLTEFEYGIYNCDSDEIVYGGYVNSSFEPAKFDLGNSSLEKTDKFLNYFGVRFPEKDRFLIGRLDFWIISSLIILLFTAFFGYAMWVILKQKRLSEIQRDFVNNLTHEFQTPISTITIATDMLSNERLLSQPERHQKYIDIIKLENNRLKNQVDAVLYASKLGKGSIELDLQYFDLHLVLNDVTESVKLELKDDFQLELGAVSTQVFADKMHFMNVIRNLLDNAKKYSKDKIEILLKTISDEKYIYIAIEDKGIGIPKQYKNQIFDKFFRVPTGNLHNVKGFGLGLNYVKEIVKKHKWELDVNSEEGQGTTFVIRIPINN